ncbi:hypothetical protein CHISP_0394 [Chitinispirillum alkaliphilum]|nr:hypothetical protein CHISP_0394 [Chitinispirillum alkaliphilum]
MSKKYGIFNQIYRKDEISVSYIIEISPDKYSDPSREWDGGLP